MRRMRAASRSPSQNLGDFIRTEKQRRVCGELVEGDVHVCTGGGGKRFSHFVSEQGGACLKIAWGTLKKLGQKGVWVIKNCFIGL